MSEVRGFKTVKLMENKPNSMAAAGRSNGVVVIVTTVGALTALSANLCFS